MIIVKPMSQNNIPRWDIDLANIFKIWTSLVKIQIDETFWFEDDLSLVDNKKTHLDNTKDEKKWKTTNK
jgi:hypothetical protein